MHTRRFGVMTRKKNSIPIKAKIVYASVQKLLVKFACIFIDGVADDQVRQRLFVRKDHFRLRCRRHDDLPSIVIRPQIAIGHMWVDEQETRKIVGTMRCCCLRL